MGVRGLGGCGAGGLEGLSKKQRKKKKLMDTDNSVVTAAGRGVGKSGGVYGTINGEVDMTWYGEHTMQFTDDVELCT